MPLASLTLSVYTIFILSYISYLISLATFLIYRCPLFSPPHAPLPSSALYQRILELAQSIPGPGSSGGSNGGGFRSGSHGSNGASLADGVAHKGEGLLSLLAELDITPESYSQHLQQLIMDVSGCVWGGGGRSLTSLLLFGQLATRNHASACIALKRGCCNTGQRSVSHGLIGLC